MVIASPAIPTWPARPSRKRWVRRCGGVTPSKTRPPGSGGRPAGSPAAAGRSSLLPRHDDPTDQGASLISTPDTAVIDNPLVDTIEMLDVLSPQQKAIVVLRDVAELKPAIADVLDTSSATVRVQLHRAHDTLRQSWSDQRTAPSSIPTWRNGSPLTQAPVTDLWSQLQAETSDAPFLAPTPTRFDDTAPRRPRVLGLALVASAATVAVVAASLVVCWKARHHGSGALSADRRWRWCPGLVTTRRSLRRLKMSWSGMLSSRTRTRLVYGIRVDAGSAAYAGQLRYSPADRRCQRGHADRCSRGLRADRRWRAPFVRHRQRARSPQHRRSGGFARVDAGSARGRS